METHTFTREKENILVQANESLCVDRIRFDIALVLVIGFLNVLPPLFSGSLGSAFIDDVLIRGDTNRSLPIITCFFALTAMSFALNYVSMRFTQTRERFAGWPAGKYFAMQIGSFAILLNSVLIFALNPILSLLCAGLAVGVLIVAQISVRFFRVKFTSETVNMLKRILPVGMLCMCGLFVMQGRISFGMMYAVNKFSGHIFSRTLELIRYSLPKPLQVKETYSGKPAAQEVPFKLAAFAREIWENKKIVFMTLLLTMAGITIQAVYLMLQRISIKDCIPSGDWENLLLNGVFMIAFSVCGSITARGNMLGFYRIFNKNIPEFIKNRLTSISSWFLSIVFAVYYAFQMRQYNQILSKQFIFATLLFAIFLISLSLSPKREAWAENYETLVDNISGFMHGCLVTLVYCMLAMRITSISIGDYFVFSTAAGEFFFGLTALIKMLSVYLDARRKRFASEPNTSVRAVSSKASPYLL